MDYKGLYLLIFRPVLCTLAAVLVINVKCHILLAKKARICPIHCVFEKKNGIYIILIK